MKGVAVLGGVLLCATAWTASSGPDLVAVPPQCFDGRGWSCDVQFMDVMGSPYLLAHGLGRPVLDARATIDIPASGSWRVKVRTRNWVPVENTRDLSPERRPGAFQLRVGNRLLPTVFGVGASDWSWEDGGEIRLERGPVDVALHDLTGFDGRCAGVVFERGTARVKGALDATARPADETLDAAFVVVGGGLPGCAAAVAAARAGVRTVLLQDRPCLGGNASAEVRVWSAGEGFRQPIVRELRGAFQNMDAASAISDAARQRVVEDETNIVLRLCTRAVGAVKGADGRIAAVRALDWRRNRMIEVRAPLFLDATGDGWLGVWAGADWRMGREGADEYHESFAPMAADADTLGASLMWTSVRSHADAPFCAPWAERSACGIAALHGDWNWEYGIHRDMIREGEAVRDRLLLAIYGAFSLAKRKPENARWVLDFVPFILGKRESRRLLGDWVFSESDVTGHVAHADAIAKTSWSIDLHYDDCRPGVDFLTTCRQPHYGRAFVPFRSIYSRNVPNLMMAGRCFSCTHVGLGSPRVMNTLAQMGVAAGYAAAICRREGISPRELERRGLVREIQRKMGGAWPGLPDPSREGWTVVDDETPGVTFGRGWHMVHNPNGEQEGNCSHAVAAKPGMGEAVYPLPVTEEGAYRLQMKVPFYPWPLESAGWTTAATLETVAGVTNLVLRQYVDQGTWVDVGTFHLKPGVRLRIDPVRSTPKARVYADGFAIRRLQERTTDESRRD